MSSCRVTVHYYFKPGKKEEGMKFIKEKILTAVAEAGGRDLEIWHDEHDPSHIVGTGLWSDMESAYAFQNKWEKDFKPHLMKISTKEPYRELYSIAA